MLLGPYFCIVRFASEEISRGVLLPKARNRSLLIPCCPVRGDAGHLGERPEHAVLRPQWARSLSDDLDLHYTTSKGGPSIRPGVTGPSRAPVERLAEFRFRCLGIRSNPFLTDFCAGRRSTRVSARPDAECCPKKIICGYLSNWRTPRPNRATQLCIFKRADGAQFLFAQPFDANELFARFLATLKHDFSFRRR